VCVCVCVCVCVWWGRGSQRGMERSPLLVQGTVRKRSSGGVEGLVLEIFFIGSVAYKSRE